MSHYLTVILKDIKWQQVWLILIVRIVLNPSQIEPKASANLKR